MFAYRCSGRDGGFGFGGKGFGILGVGMKGFGFRAAEFWGFGFQDEGVISRPQNFGLRLQGAKGTWVDVLGLGSAMSPEVSGLRLKAFYSGVQVSALLLGKIRRGSYGGLGLGAQLPRSGC